jgi:fumarate hydratase class II
MDGAASDPGSAGPPRLWGPETEKAIANFPISGEPIDPRVVRWLARIKSAAASVNAELGLLDAEVAAAIVDAADAVARGDHADQFPVDVFQTGSGTSSNMNVNEVVSALTGGRAHPNDHVNLGQSSNDVFPSAVQLAVLEAAAVDLLPALDRLADALMERATAFADVVKPGRTHLMDAVPVMLGREFAGYASQIRAAAGGVVATLPQLGRTPLGGTAVGTGLNTHPEFAARVNALLARHLPFDVGAMVGEPDDRFAAQAARDPLVALAGALEVVAVASTKICNDLRWMASGPRTGLAEIRLPELQKGSSIMPGKVNPVVPEAVLQVAAQVIGNATAVTVAGMQGNFELNVMVPVMARNVLQSVSLLASGSRLLADRCVAGIEADEERCAALADLTLAVATALNPVVGYDEATAIVREAATSGRTLREVALDRGVDPEVVDAALDPRVIAGGNEPTGHADIDDGPP